MRGATAVAMGAARRSPGAQSTGASASDRDPHRRRVVAEIGQLGRGETPLRPRFDRTLCIARAARATTWSALDRRHSCRVRADLVVGGRRASCAPAAGTRVRKGQGVCARRHAQWERLRCVLWPLRQECLIVVSRVSGGVRRESEVGGGIGNLGWGLLARCGRGGESGLCGRGVRLWRVWRCGCVACRTRVRWQATTYASAQGGLGSTVSSVSV
mmetsp:Transcript_29582/g.81239  ORF Transcript_29582/g.81239 Transcript_29582/m.81239 type:complete len:214 (+) Transcript_29582:680-1321(+)